MIALPKVYNQMSVLPAWETLNLESKLQDLSLYEFQIEAERTGIEVGRAFDSNPLLPGAILTEKEKLLGMISRRRFLEYMSRPYGLELFLKRRIKCLYLLARAETLVLPSNTLIVKAAKQSWQRPAHLLYEPLVVEIEPQVYKLLDVHQLMVAQSQIHELATHLLNEQTQAHLIQTEKMASLGQMVAGIAHEILNPVNFISGNIDYLSKYSDALINLITAYEEGVTEPPPRVVEIKEEIELDYLQEDLLVIVNSIKQGTERLIKIINSMRNFSHMGEGSRQPADIHECIDSTLLILHNRIKYSIELVKNYGELPLVPCYSGQLSQVFTNIISNGIDALMEKSAALKEAGKSAPKWQARIEISTCVVEAENSRWAAIRITDNGPGIPEEIQQRIFETFFTTKPVGKGTGLGLAISRQIVTEKHKGRLNLRSQPEVGTEFEILLPLE
jgi:signal transduction histidine kinase